jgi:PAS domain-containing protein
MSGMAGKKKREDREVSSRNLRAEAEKKVARSAGQDATMSGTGQDQGADALRVSETGLRKSEAQYRLLAEHTMDTVWLLDMNLKPTYQSRSGAKLRGFTPQEIFELPVEKQVTPESLKLGLSLTTSIDPPVFM